MIPREVIAKALMFSENPGFDADLSIAAFATLHCDFLHQAESHVTSSLDMWSYDLMHHLAWNEPTLAFKAILACLTLCKTNAAAAILAAGPLEDIIVRHGAEVITDIELEATRSARFRYLLSGVWESRASKEIWARVTTARQPGPNMDAGHDLPDT